jgi:hypothetical protein
MNQWHRKYQKTESSANETVGKPDVSVVVAPARLNALDGPEPQRLSESGL